MLIINKMIQLAEKAANYYIIARMSEAMGMYSEAASNYFKALFAAADYSLFTKFRTSPKDHTDRFCMLKKNLPELYTITDRVFSTYRRTYTQELSKEEVITVRKKVEEAFKHAEIKLPADNEIKERIAKIIKN